MTVRVLDTLNGAHPAAVRHHYGMYLLLHAGQGRHQTITPRRVSRSCYYPSKCREAEPAGGNYGGVFYVQRQGQMPTLRRQGQDRRDRDERMPYLPGFKGLSELQRPGSLTT
jgi:hypothetical protein